MEVDNNGQIESHGSPLNMLEESEIHFHSKVVNGLLELRNDMVLFEVFGLFIGNGVTSYPSNETAPQTFSLIHSTC